ncbi:MerR family transcriptional regulator [Anoxynatronum buryatiense]|uniref:DNA-binding transcriptional regulator, MerR family n=1 Tax=Anoxynatronum buryatiense TaxID=489973 RepID=A0AA45WV07_9CLOT|nr:MerR family transcriptional regulator [Anoxynatronum buryatiense]SMP50645.1 DNA-binding transcriptional regulator, MerR family [Anoxynatronum buryatiense]
MYRISHFAKMVGLPQSKIRFYEKNGLLDVHRDENGYRYFTPGDAFRINAFRVLTQYGFTVEQAVGLIDQRQSSESFIQSLEKQRNHLHHQIQLMNKRYETTDRVIKLLQAGMENPMVLEEVEDHLYVLASVGLDFSISDETEKALQQLAELLPITAYARIIHRDDLLSSHPAINPSYSLALPVSKAGMLGEHTRAHVRRLTMGTCVRYYREKTRQESAQKESFRDLFNFLEKHQLKVVSDVLLLPSFLNLDGKGRDIEIVYVPVAPVQLVASKR